MNVWNIKMRLCKGTSLRQGLNMRLLEVPEIELGLRHLRWRDMRLLKLPRSELRLQLVLPCLRRLE